MFSTFGRVLMFVTDYVQFAACVRQYHQEMILGGGLFGRRGRIVKRCPGTVFLSEIHRNTMESL